VFAGYLTYAAGPFASYNNILAKQQRAEQKAFAMKYSEGQLRVIIDTIPTQAWSCSSDGSAEFCNRRWLDYTGLSVEEALGWSWKVAIHPDDLSRMLEIFQEALNSGQPWEVEARLRRFDGEFRWFLFRASPLRDESGKVVKWYGTNTDIDERKKAEEKLQRSEADLLEAQRLSHTGSWRHNLLSGEVTVSPEVFRIRGIQHDDDASRAGFFFDRIHPEDRRAVKQVYDELRSRELIMKRTIALCFLTEPSSTSTLSAILS
jgi:PAS domain S-box-containing protein